MADKSLQEHLFHEAQRTVRDLHVHHLISDPAFDYVNQVLRGEQKKKPGNKQAAALPPPPPAVMAPPPAVMGPVVNGYPAAPMMMYPQPGYPMMPGAPPAQTAMMNPAAYPPGQPPGPSGQPSKPDKKQKPAQPKPAQQKPAQPKSKPPPQQHQQQHVEQHHSVMGRFAGRVGDAASWGFGSALGRDFGHAVFNGIAGELKKH